MRFRPRFAKGCNWSYSTTLGLVFKLVWVPFNFQYGTKSRRYSTASVLANLARPSLTRGLLQSSPLRTRRPRRVPDQPKYQDLLSWPRPIRLVLTVPCTTSVRPVPTVPVPRPCVQCRASPMPAHLCPHTPAHMPVASATTRSCSCPHTSTRMWREIARIGFDTTVTTRPGVTAKIYSAR